MEITADQMFINMRNLPKRGSSAFKELVKLETEKCLGGVTIQGIKISGWLYFHINHWNIRVDGVDKFGNDTREKSIAHLRDNEWIRAEWMEKCRLEKKAYIEVGGRQGGKSELEASYIGYTATFFENSQNIIVCSTEQDMELIADKLQFGLSNIWEGLYRGLIDKDWSKKTVRLGYKDTDNVDHIWSYILLRNTAGGTKTEVAAGTTARSLVIDEIGKSTVGAVYEAAKPAFIGERGLRFVPILVGTGGSFEKGKDAERYFFNPTANGFLSTINDRGIETGLFLSGIYRQDCKYWTTLREYLNREKNLNIPPGELDKVKIKVSDKNLAEKLILGLREEKAKDPDHSEYLKSVMYFPLTEEECFMSQAVNNFNQDACKARKAFLDKEYEPEYLELFRDDKNKVGWKFSSKRPISKFPVKPNDNKDAPLCVYERPDYSVPHGTYVIGLDPYNEDNSSDKINSLGSICVYKRMYNPLGEFQNSIVATWSGRCKTVKDFHELCLLVSEWYNAIDGVLPENEDKTLIQYFLFKRKGHYLADSMDLAKQINPLTKSSRAKGLSASTPNQRHYMSLMVSEVNDETEIIVDDGTPTGNIIEVIGANKINDPMLLEEMIQYRGKTSASKGIHDGNYDRIIAFGHALTLARYNDIKYPSNWKPKKQEETNTHHEPIIKTPFGYMTKGSLFIKSKPYHSRGTKMFPR